MKEFRKKCPKKSESVHDSQGPEETKEFLSLMKPVEEAYFYRLEILHPTKALQVTIDLAEVVFFVDKWYQEPIGPR